DVMINDVVERLRTAIVEVGRMLPEPAQGRRAVAFLCCPRGVGRVHPSLRGSVQHTIVVVGEPSIDMATRAIGVENRLSPGGCSGVIKRSRRRRRGDAVLVSTQGWELAR